MKTCLTCDKETKNKDFCSKEHEIRYEINEFLKKLKQIKTQKTKQEIMADIKKLEKKLDLVPHEQIDFTSPDTREKFNII